MKPEEETTEKEPKIKKFYIITLSIFILFLITTYFLLGPKILYILEGYLYTKNINNLTINHNNYTIEFSQESFKDLKDIYLNTQKNEFKACLTGEIKENKYIITEIILPEQVDHSVFHVKSPPCSKETIISLHSHPYKSCIPSEQDIKTHKLIKENNPYILSAIMCEENRFNIYG